MEVEVKKAAQRGESRAAQGPRALCCAGEADFQPALVQRRRAAANELTESRPIGPTMGSVPTSDWR